MWLIFVMAFGGCLICRAQKLTQGIDMFSTTINNVGVHLVPAFKPEIESLIGCIDILLVFQAIHGRLDHTVATLCWAQCVRYPFVILPVTRILVFGYFNERPFICLQN